MAESGMVSQPIIPSLPEVEAAKDPFGILNAPSPIIAPLIPNGVPVNLPINTQVQGDFQTGPNPGAKSSNLTNGTADYVKALKGQMTDDSLVRDKFKYGKTYSYGAGYKNANFDRYYTHPKFKELGFSPYRDNDSFYNERSSWWDDFSRMRGQWGSLAWSGFKSIWGSEAEANENMEKGMAIGSSTRGGFGGWITNFGLNSAYTVGVMGEIILEDLGLAAVEALSFGTATPAVGTAAAVRNSMAFGRLYKAWNGTYDFMKGLKNAETAKQFWNASKTGDLLKWVNPLSRSFDFTKNLINGTGSFNKLSGMAQVTKGFGQFYRDIREMNVAHSEALLEGEGASSRYQQNLIDDFYAKNGRMPEGKEAEEIWEKGQSIKATVSLANDLTIYYSNKLVFEDLFEGFRPGSKISEAFLKGSDKYLKRAPAQQFKVGQAVIQTGTKTGLKKTKDFLLKSSYVPWSKKYFVGNLGEALQESSQEIISSSAMDYYDKIDTDPSQIGFYRALASIGKGTGEQFSAQGFDTFLQGYLMGSLIQGTGAAGKGIYNKVKGTSDAKATAEKADNDIINAANHVLNNSLIYGDDKVTMASAIKNANQAKKEAIQEGDEKTSHDMGDDLNITYLHTLARSGNMNLITEHVDDMLTLDDESLAEAFNLTEAEAPEIRSKLNTLKLRSEGYQKKYDYAKNKRPNPYDPWLFNKDKNPKEFNDELNKYIAHENAVANLLFATEDYERISQRMSSIGKNLSGQGTKFQNLVNVIKGGTPVANAASSDVSLLVDHVQRGLTMKSLQDQIFVLDTGTPEQKRQADELREQLDLLKEWNQMADHYMGEMTSDRKAQYSKEEYADREERAKMKPGATVKNKKTGDEFKIHSVKGDKVSVKDKSNKIKTFSKKSLNVIKQVKTKPFEAISGDTVSESIESMYDVYQRYMRLIAKMKKGYVFDEQLNEAFKEIKDYYALEQDAMRMVHTINVLSDPEYFDRYIQIEAKIQAERKSRKIANLEKAMQKFREMSSDNKLLNNLFDMGVFVIPEDVEKLKDLTLVDFYDAVTKEVISEGSAKYNDIIKVLEAYAVETGKVIPWNKAPEEIPSDEQSPTSETPLEDSSTTSTTTTPVSKMNKVVLDDLVTAYKKASAEAVSYGDAPFEAADGTLSEIMASSRFQDWIITSGTAAEITELHNKPKEQPTVTKINQWSPGNKWIFSGITPEGNNISNIPIEVISEEGPDVDNAEDTNYVILKNLDTNTEFMIDTLVPHTLKPFETLGQEAETTLEFMDNYESITNKSQLDKWYEEALNEVGSGNITSDFVREKLDAKRKELGESLNFEELLPGVLVLMSDNRTIKVVKANDGTNITLVSPDGGKPVIINKAIFKDKIKMKYSEYIEEVDQTPNLTDKEVIESDKAVSVAKDIDDATKIAEEIDEALDSNSDDIDDELGDAFNNCKVD